MMHCCCTTPNMERKVSFLQKEFLYERVVSNNYYTLNTNSARINFTVFVEFKLNKASCNTNEIECTRI